jgi:hypothetical protein
MNGSNLDICCDSTAALVIAQETERSCETDQVGI